MELNHLRYFFAVARDGGFTRAAKQLRVQQPAISKMVRQLEESLGLTLLERGKRGVVLTNAGAEVYSICQEIFGAVGRIESFSEQEKSECQGPLRFGTSDVLAGTVVAEVLADYLREFPRVRPSLFTGTAPMICDEIERSQIEFGLFFTVPDEERFSAEEIAAIPFRLVIASGRVRDARVRRSFIGSREVDYPKARSFPAMEMLRKQGISPETLVSSNNLEVHRKMVLKGLGIALLPAFVVDEDIRKKRLSILYPEKKFSYSLKLVTRKGKVLSRNALVFIERFKAGARY